MDLAGLAALLGVPAVAVAAFIPLARGWGAFGRLERIEKVLTETSTAGLQRKMLENARDDLAEQAAFTVLAPRLLTLLLTGSFGLAYAIAAIAAGFVQFYADQPYVDVWLFVALIVVCVALIGVSVAMLVRRARRRREWRDSMRDRAFRSGPATGTAGAPPATQDSAPAEEMPSALPRSESSDFASSDD